MNLEDKLYQLDLIITHQFDTLLLVLNLLKKEDRAMSDFNLSQLNECYLEKEKLNQQLAGLERYRQTVATDIERLINKPSWRLTVSSLSEEIDHPLVQKIQQKFQDFDTQLQQVKRAIAKNKHLIQRSLHSVQQSLQTMFEASETGIQYDQSAKVQPQRMTETRLSVNI